MKRETVVKCEQVREAFLDLAAGMGSPNAETQAHLQVCSECSMQLQQMRKTMALLDEWEAPEPSAYFDTRLGARLREEKAKGAASWSWVHRLRHPALAASFALVIMFGVAGIKADHWWHESDEAIATAMPTPAAPGTAVGDLQALDRNNDLYADFDVLDDLQVQDDAPANQ